MFKRHFIDAGYAIKSSNLTIVEFGLLCATIFFNTSIAGLKDPAKVETVHLELSHAAEAFIYGNFSSEKPSVKEERYHVDTSPLTSSRNPGSASAANWPSRSNLDEATERTNNFRSLVSYFRNLNLFATWLRTLTLQKHPHLLEASGQVFREMHIQVEQTLRMHEQATANTKSSGGTSGYESDREASTKY